MLSSFRFLTFKQQESENHSIMLTSFPASSAPKVTNSNELRISGKAEELPKCFGTDYFGKWNMSGMTFESMKIDRPEFQTKCAICSYFERCYLCNHIRLIRIKK